MLDLYFFNVGHGDSILIKLPDNTWGIVDCNKDLNQEEPNVLKFLKGINVTELRFLCLTHPHDDHLNGLDKIIEHYQENIGQFFTYDIRVYKESENNSNENLHKFLMKLHSLLMKMRKQGIHKGFVKKLRSGQVPILLDDVEIEVLNPSEILMDLVFTGSIIKKESDYNKVSIVLRLKYRGINIILGADATESNWNEIITIEKTNKTGRLLQSNILKVSHHGSKHNNSNKILESLVYKNKCFAVISTDGGIRYPSLPSESVIEYLNKRGALVCRTDNLGFNSLTSQDISDLGQGWLTDMAICDSYPEEENNTIHDGFIKLSIDNDGNIDIREIPTILEEIEAINAMHKLKV